jgi:hypothetical protein
MGRAIATNAQAGQARKGKPAVPMASPHPAARSHTLRRVSLGICPPHCRQGIAPRPVPAP